MVLLVLYVFFFFKQKTAYEMRISDWSSDVCSSDLVDAQRTALADHDAIQTEGMGIGFISRMYLAFGVHDPCVVNITIARRSIVWDHDMIIAFAEIIVETIRVDKWVDEAGEEGHVRRSEERRVGKDCGRRCRF